MKSSPAAKKTAPASKKTTKPAAKNVAKHVAKSSDTIGRMIRDRLKAVERSPAELAEAVEVPIEYVEDLMSGRRRPPRPERTDLYDRMTSFLQLSRNDLATCAKLEREATAPAKIPAPKPTVRKALLDLCDPKTAKKLEQRRSKNGHAELSEFFQRLLDVTQSTVRRLLTDQISLRIAAQGSPSSYAAMRLQVLEFLDTTPDTLTIDDLTKFLRPRVASWDVDWDTGALKVVLHSSNPDGPPSAG